MANESKEWLDKVITKKLLNWFDFKEFSDFKEIGKGAFGKVYNFEWRCRAMTVALKTLKNWDEKNVHKFVKSSHPNIIQFYGVTKDPYNIVLQLADGGTLCEYLRKNLNLQWADKLRLAKEIAQGLIYLHANDIIHLDLNDVNRLWLSKHVNEESITLSSLAYIDPQYLKDTAYNRDKKSNVYSFGIILWEISSGHVPFNVQPTTSLSILSRILKNDREKPIAGTPTRYIELYTRC
ncbi:kinase-like protein [Gigaspora margarita]|uniref:Kinase-like protein n=1 Tax=Gigaspora margarita TaxID=4874 RepID=A0A8H4AAZ0_GIGMA|nr:kinase-like protein [Gigaspora margarita]